MIYNFYYKKTQIKDICAAKSPQCRNGKKKVSLMLGLIYFALALTETFLLVRTASVCCRFFFPRNHPSWKRRPKSDTYLRVKIEFRGILNVEGGIIQILRQLFLVILLRCGNTLSLMIVIQSK